MNNNAIAAKAKAVYGKFLSKTDYDNLIQRNSVNAVVAYLKATPRYKNAFLDVDENTVHRGMVEDILSEYIFKRYIRLRKFGSGKKGGIMDFYIKRTEAEQLIKAIAAIHAGTQQAYFLSLPSYLLDYLSFNPADISNMKNLRELAQALNNVKIYRPLIPYLNADNPDINKCTTVVNSCYIKWAFTALNSEFRGTKKELLKKFFLKKVDSDNVLLCYRLKKFFDEDDERIKELVVPYYYRIKPADVDAALKSQNPTDSLISLLSEKCVPAKMDVDENFPEISMMRANYEYFRHRLSLTNDETEALFSLLVLADNERANLRTIIEGIRYGENPAEIEKLVII